MHSETAHIDSSEYFEDTSLVYVRDREGVLHSPPGYGQGKPLSTEPTKDSMDTLHGATCAMKNESSQESPCNLYQICKNFIAKNLHLVESLVDFPEAIGNDLFAEALQIQVFHKSPRYLNTFCVAYKSLVLKHLALRQSTVMINENLKFLQCFNSLTKLDLGHCRLGDSHEYLLWIGKMKSLEHLCLKDNSLTDVGISSWTLPHRMLHSGPESLRTLDLSCNPQITDFSAKCLVKFPHLKSLNLSATSTTITRGIKKITRLTSLKLVSYIPEFNKEVFTETKGWATPFISELFGRSKDPKPHGKQDINPDRKPFYQSFKVSGTKPSTMKIDTNKVNSNNYPVMLLQSEELVLPDTLRSIDTESLKEKNRKRTGTNIRVSLTTCKRRKTINHEKKAENVKETGVLGTDEELDESDINLLENYLKIYLVR